MSFMSKLLKYGAPIAIGLATGGTGGAIMAGMGALAKGKGSEGGGSGETAEVAPPGPKKQKDASIFDAMLADSFANSQSKPQAQGFMPRPKTQLEPLEIELLSRNYVE